MTWPATQAKAKFSEVLDKAETEGPQLVRRRKREFYVITREQHEALSANARPNTPRNTGGPIGTLGDFFRNSPLTGSGIQIKRIKSGPRPLEF